MLIYLKFYLSLIELFVLNRLNTMCTQENAVVDIAPILLACCVMLGWHVLLCITRNVRCTKFSLFFVLDISLALNVRGLHHGQK